MVSLVFWASFSHFHAFLAHFAFFGAKMHFGAKNLFGLKKRSWSPKGAFWASWAPSLAGWEPAREEREQRRAGGRDRGEEGGRGAETRAGGSWEGQDAFSTTHPLPLHPLPPPPGAPHLTPITGGGLFGIYSNGIVDPRFVLSDRIG